MYCISWNVNGIRAAWNHGLSGFLESTGADIYALQETKINERFLPAEMENYEAYWNFCNSRKGYSGTLILTKLKPLRVSYDFDNYDFETEGRIITLEFETFYFVNCYVPNSQSSQRRKDYREEWDRYLLQYLLDLRTQKSVVLCGDFNVPISDKDIYAENVWQEWNAQGFVPMERDNLLNITDAGFVDTYRHLHPEDENVFTWWSNRLNKRKENRGWRLDYFFVTGNLCPYLTEAGILSEVKGSDHCPIFLRLEVSGEEGQQKTPLREGKYVYKDLLEMEKRGLRYDYIGMADTTKLWESIDWEDAERRLAQMQRSLTKAARAREGKQIERWQKCILHSLCGKLLAVRHVCSSAAGAGVDGVKWCTPHEKMTAALTLSIQGYRAMPERLLLIKSKNGKERRIHIETYYDSAVQTLCTYALDPIAEAWGDRKSFAYRKGRSAYDMHEYLIRAFSGKDTPKWIIMADVRKCYENISHEWLLHHIPLPRSILTEFLRAGYVFAGELFPTEKGVGIGCRISPIAANMALDGMQKYLYGNLYPEGDIDYANGNLLRYADDIIVSARGKEEAEQILKLIRKFLAERGLSLSEEKTKVLPVSQGFTFMSRAYEMRGSYLFAKPSQEATERFMESMRNTILRYHGSQKALIEKINHKIDGWVTYHKVSEADEVFRQMDVYVSALLLELSEKKHPKWNRAKLLKKYWYVDYKGKHHYSLPEKRHIRVKSMSDTLFAPYQPIKTNFNPYLDTKYLEERTKERQIRSVTGIYRSIWNRQCGRCYYCGRMILADEERELIVANERATGTVKRMAYVHTRCMEKSFFSVESEEAPISLNELTDLLFRLENPAIQTKTEYSELYAFFHICDKRSVTLSFSEIEQLIGKRLGNGALRKEFWYRTGFDTISQCWLENGYQIAALHLENRKRVVFRLVKEYEKTSSVTLPEVLKYGRIPLEAKYELEHYFQYVIQKYGL